MFTRCINVRNVNEALPHGLLWLQNRGVAEASRNGAVLTSPDPVITCYSNPTERVLFSPMRDANPFFHFMEGLWMLAGRNDVEWITRFNKRFSEYSDDGATYWGAYGYRWRKWFGIDQLGWLIEELTQNPGSRRAVLAMWDGEEDPQRLMKGEAKDVPCNLSVMFRIIQGKLNMMVNCRSNDIFWGAYGANAVHMSMMQEFLASAIGVEVGNYWQNSWNFHAYTDVYPEGSWKDIAADCAIHDAYAHGMVKPSKLVNVGWHDWLIQLDDFMDFGYGSDPAGTAYTDPTFQDVAVPMLRAWDAHKAKDYGSAQHHAEQIAAYDWRLACKMWLSRRAEAYRRKEMAGV